MAFENEEDYLDNLLKSITSEDNGDSGEHLLETDSEMQMPETFGDSQEEDVDEDIFERLLLQQEEELHTDKEMEQSAEDDMNFMEALFGNQDDTAEEEDILDVPVEDETKAELKSLDDLLPKEAVSEDVMPEDEVSLQMENTEFSEADDIGIPMTEDSEVPVIEDTEFPETNAGQFLETENDAFLEPGEMENQESENAQFPMLDNDELPEFEDEMVSAVDDEILPDLEDIILPEVEDEVFAEDFMEEIPDEISEDIVADGEDFEDFTQYPDNEEVDLNIGNELIGQIDGLFSDVEEELEEEQNVEPFGLMAEEDKPLGVNMEDTAQEADYSNLEVDDELKALLGVESPEQLADIPSEGEGLSENELVKLAQMESAASFEMDPGIEEDAMGTAFVQEDNFGGESQGALEAEQPKEPGQNSNKNTTGLIAKLLAIFKKNNGDKSQDAEGNENQKVLDELFDENGELLDDDKKIKKKGLFFKSGKKKSGALDTSDEDDDDDSDDIESPEEIARKEEKARKKKEKKEKKEKEKQEKKEKKEQKPKKEKKPKVKKEKPPVNPADLIHVKPVAIIIMAVIVAGIVGYVYFFVSSFNYNNAMDRAAYYMADKRYTNAYRAVSGIEMKSEEDIALKEQIVTIMYVQHYYDAYERYLKVDLQFEALDSLIRGIKTYDDCYQFAIEQGITADYEIVRAKLVAALEQYGITEAMARTYGAMTNYTQYKYILEGYGGVSNDSGN